MYNVSRHYSNERRMRDYEDMDYESGHYSRRVTYSDEAEDRGWSRSRYPSVKREPLHDRTSYDNYNYGDQQTYREEYPPLRRPLERKRGQRRSRRSPSPGPASRRSRKATSKARPNQAARREAQRPQSAQPTPQAQPAQPHPQENALEATEAKPGNAATSSQRSQKPRSNAAVKQNKYSKLEDLQALLSNPPPNHPGQSWLLSNLEIGQSHIVDDIRYLKHSKTQILVTGVGYHHSQRLKEVNDNVMHPSNVWFPRQDFTDASEIPSLTPNADKCILRHSVLSEKPSNTIGEHSNIKGSCVCPSLDLGTHFPLLVPLSCRKSRYLKSNFAKHDLQITEQFMQPNPALAFSHNRQSKKLQLLVPTPFTPSYRWRKMFFTPAMANNSSELKNAIFYSLHNEQNSRIAEAAYLTEPDSWTDRMHPMFSEPAEQEELHEWAKGLYGVETLFRVHQPRHPARHKEICFYSMTDHATWEVPTVIDPGMPHIMEAVISEALRPFLVKGHGMITCPICIFAELEGQPSLCVFDRASFLEHYETRHHKNVGIVGLYFDTQLGTRQMEAHTIYTMCCLDRQVVPVAGEQAFAGIKGPHNVKISTHLQSLVLMDSGPDLRGQQEAGAMVIAQQQPAMDDLSNIMNQSLAALAEAI